VVAVGGGSSGVVAVGDGSGMRLMAVMVTVVLELLVFVWLLLGLRVELRVVVEGVVVATPLNPIPCPPDCCQLE